MKRKTQGTAILIVLTLLAAFIIQCFWSMPVMAAEIKHVDITGVTPPAVGASPTVEGINCETEGVVLVSGGSPWYEYDYDLMRHLGPDAIFEAGKKYGIIMTIDAAEGYALADPDSMTAKVNNIYNASISLDPLQVVYFFPPLPEEGDPPVKIDEVLLSVEAPEAGKGPSEDVEVKDGEGNTDSVDVLPPLWHVYDSEKGKWVSMEEFKPFEAGKKYRITIGLAANTKSYAFAASDEMTIKVNGQLATRFYAESSEFTDYRIVEHEFELPPLSDPDEPTPPATGETETPQEPDKPTPPDSNKPTPPDSGETPKPTPEADKDKKTDKTSDLPATGESRGIALWLGLALLLVGAVLLISRKKMTSK